MSESTCNSPQKPSSDTPSLSTGPASSTTSAKLTLGESQELRDDIESRLVPIVADYHLQYDPSCPSSCSVNYTGPPLEDRDEISDPDALVYHRRYAAAHRQIRAKETCLAKAAESTLRAILESRSSEPGQGTQMQDTVTVMMRALKEKIVSLCTGAQQYACRLAKKGEWATETPWYIHIGKLFIDEMSDHIPSKARQSAHRRLGRPSSTRPLSTPAQSYHQRQSLVTASSDDTGSEPSALTRSDAGSGSDIGRQIRQLVKANTAALRQRHEQQGRYALDPQIRAQSRREAKRRHRAGLAPSVETAVFSAR